MTLAFDGQSMMVRLMHASVVFLVQAASMVRLRPRMRCKESSVLARARYLNWSGLLSGSKVM